MKRREFIGLLGGAAASSTLLSQTVRAQTTGKMRRLGVLFVSNKEQPEAAARIAALNRKLDEQGWIEGRNLRIDYRFGDSDATRIRAATEELIGLGPDVLIAQGVVGAAALQRATKRIPVVFVQVVDPIGGGFVTNLARPEANLTGFTDFEYTITGKWFEVLKEIAPGLTRVLVVVNPDNRKRWDGYFGEISKFSASLGVEVVPAGVHDAGEIERAIEVFAKTQNAGMVVLPDATTSVHLQQIIGLAARHRLPAVYGYSYFAKSGGLLAYSSNVVDQYSRAGSYVDQLLRGVPVKELPVQASDRFELVINLKTAAALGLQVTPTLLARADEVIE